ncbi:SMP-30/gluconolactonase/LRE family protein [uncultured Shewanella sp.]|uniref:SMP-30/gluconolactonase/LRE family protein n=1 Tax=uncultured Shewanella sp. TaxID=173975 RepID=UPI002619E249|nr:SMP-30/gluconolactonase/LRE family protein [uncultured Shewanella sp.]
MRSFDIALNTKAALGECPRWDEKNQVLYWTDINRYQLHRFDPVAKTDEYLTFNEEIGCFSLRPYGGFILAMRSGFYLTSGWHTQVEKICDPEAHLKQNRLNDGRCDAAGRFLCGSYYAPKDESAANLWQLNNKLEANLIYDNLLTTNGIGFSPDNRTFYYSDSPKYRIYQCDYDIKTGAVSNRKVFHEFPFGQGKPDGCAIDIHGNYWSALFEGGRIVKLNPKGEILEELPTPVHCPTMMAFGGPDLKTLFITSAGERPDTELATYPNSGCLLTIQVDTPGMIEHRFCI